MEERAEESHRETGNKRIMGAVGEMKVPRMKSSSNKRFVYLSRLGPVLLFTGDNKKPCNEMRAWKWMVGLPACQ